MYIFFLHLCISQILHVIEVNFFIKKDAGSTQLLLVSAMVLPFIRRIDIST